MQANAATGLVSIFLDRDIIHFVVGTRINGAHQDTNFLWNWIFAAILSRTSPSCWNKNT
jgi:hypothetical protein